MISTEGSNQDTAREKYDSRGWTMVQSLSVSEMANSNYSFRPGKRYVGDSHCWTIPLQHEPLPEGIVESNTWALTHDLEYIPTMSFKVLLTNCLDFSYLVVDEALAQFLWPVICPTDVPKE